MFQKQMSSQNLEAKSIAVNNKGRQLEYLISILEVVINFSK